MEAFIVDAFTETQFEGNRAGVVLDAGRMTARQMQSVAAEINASETAFLRNVDGNVYKIEYFTPTTAIDFCGHATVALFHMIAASGAISVTEGGAELLADTKAGLFEVTVTKQGERYFVQLAHDQPAQFAELDENTTVSDVCSALKITDDSLDDSFPVKFGKTANWHLFVPVRSQSILDAISYDSDLLSAILSGAKAITAHVFCQSGDTYYVRNFGPHVGIVEDPATGSAAGAFGAYLIAEKLLPAENCRLKIIQGEAMGRPSQIDLQICCIDGVLRSVNVIGTAVASFKMSLLG